MNRCRKCGCSCIECCSNDGYRKPGHGNRVTKEKRLKPRGQRSSQRFLDHLRSTSPVCPKYDAEDSEQEFADDFTESVRIFPNSSGHHERSHRRTKQPKQKCRYYTTSFLEAERRCREHPAEIVNPRVLTTDSEYDLYYGGGEEIVDYPSYDDRRFRERRTAAYPLPPDFDIRSPDFKIRSPEALRYNTASSEHWKFQSGRTRQQTSERHTQYERNKMGFAANEVRVVTKLDKPKMVDKQSQMNGWSSDGSSVRHVTGTTTAKRIQTHRYQTIKNSTSEVPKFPSPESDRDNPILSSTSSISFLRRTKPVQKLRREWQAKVDNHVTKVETHYTKVVVERRPTNNPEKRRSDNSENSEDLQPLPLSTELEPAGSPAIQPESPRAYQVPEKDKNQVSNKAKGQQRDSYIESESLKRLLKSDSLIESATEVHDGDLRTQEPTKPKPSETNIKPYFEKWKQFRRRKPIKTEPVPDVGAATDGLSFLEFREAHVTMNLKSTKEKRHFSDSKPKDVKSLSEPEAEPPRSRWWNFTSWGKTSAAAPDDVTEQTTNVTEHFESKSATSSHTHVTQISYAMAIGGHGNHVKGHREPELDEIVKMEGRATSLKVKRSKLAVNIPFEKLKSSSQVNLSIGKSKLTLVSGQAQKSHSSEYIDLRCPACHEMIDYKNPGDLMESHGHYWHEQCFNCSVCHGRLNSNNHFFEDGNLYCVQHYAEKVNAPKCAGCGHYIFDSLYTRARGKTWHKNHFRCSSCNRPIIDTKFVSRKNGDVVCFDCHQQHFSHTCAACDKRILPTEQFVFLKTTGKYWHANDDCLQCHSCGQSLLSQSKNRLIFVKNGFIFCNKYCAQRSPI